jgi:hypothetical protein
MVTVAAAGEYELQFTVQPLHGAAVYDLGFELSAVSEAGFEIIVREVAISGQAEIEIVGSLPVDKNYRLPGWIVYGSNCVNPMLHTGRKIQTFVNNDDRGLFCTGTRDWKNYLFETDFVRFCARRSGIVVRYQGLERYLALTFADSKMQIIRRYYGDEILFEQEYAAGFAEKIPLKIIAAGKNVKFYLSDEPVFEWFEPELIDGAVGYLSEQGTCGFEYVRLKGMK